MAQLGKSIVRIAADPRKRTAPKDVNNGTGQVQFYAGNDVEVQLALFDNGAFIDDLANIASWRLQLKAMGADDAPPAHYSPALTETGLP